MSDAVDNAASGTDDYDGNDTKNTTTITNMLTTMAKPINYEDDGDNYAKYDADDCNVWIVP